MSKPDMRKWVTLADQLGKLDGQIEAFIESTRLARFRMKEDGIGEDIMGMFDRARADLRCAQNALRESKKSLLETSI